MARRNERYSTNAYFEMVLTSNLYDELPERVTTNPKFWDFLESTRRKSYNERWAGNILKWNTDIIAAQLDDIRANKKTLEVAKAIPSLEHMLQEHGETLEAKIESIPEGAKLHFLRDVFCVAEKAEEGSQAGTPARQRLRARDPVAAREAEDRDQEGSGSSASETEADRGTLEQDAGTAGKVWEWTESDSEAEQWLFEWDPVAAGGMEISPVGVESASDWT